MTRSIPLPRLAGVSALLAVLVGGVPGCAYQAVSAPIGTQGTVQPAFSPWEDVEALITGAIQKAHKQILVQAYMLSSKPIATALIHAAERGVDVRILADKEQHARLESSKLVALDHAGIPIWLETRYNSAHNKIILIDSDTRHPVLITGSYNFTWHAQHKNAENVLIIRDNPELAARYAQDWERHRQDATRFKP